MAADEPAAPIPAVRERLGPLVHRSAHHGALLLLIGSIEFIIANIVTQIGYGPSYSLSGNYISDLGARYCGVFGGSGSLPGHYACSPWSYVFNAGIIIMGILLILSALLIRTAFRPRKSRWIGLGALAIAGIGAIGVGLSPEDVNITVHAISAFLAFAGAGFALIFLGFAMFRDTRWDGFRMYTVVSGLVDLIALILFFTKNYAGLGVGGMERLIVAPVLLWAIVAGIHLLRIPTYAPSGVSGSTS